MSDQIKGPTKPIIPSYTATTHWTMRKKRWKLNKSRWKLVLSISAFSSNHSSPADSRQLISALQCWKSCSCIDVWDRATPANLSSLSSGTKLFGFHGEDYTEQHLLLCQKHFALIWITVLTDSVQIHTRPKNWQKGLLQQAKAVALQRFDSLTGNLLKEAFQWKTYRSSMWRVSEERHLNAPF